MKQEYILKATSNELRDKGFRYNYQNKYYTYDFPVYRYKRRVLITCKVVVYEDDNSVNFTVLEANGNLCATYYNRDLGKNLNAEIIDKNINREFKRLGIKKVGEIQ